MIALIKFKNCYKWGAGVLSAAAQTTLECFQLGVDAVPVGQHAECQSADCERLECVCLPTELTLST